MTESELIAQLKEEVKGLTTYLTDPTDYENGINDAGRETGFTLPATVDFKIYWIKDRSKRHLFNYLRSEQSMKFKAKKFNLEQRFEHLHELIKQMDINYLAAVEARPDMFTSANTYDLFGFKVDPGFSYDYMGRDTTYTDDNKIAFDPSDES